MGGEEGELDGGGWEVREEWEGRAGGEEWEVKWGRWRARGEEWEVQGGWEVEGGR